jgi:hypothetical protein
MHIDFLVIEAAGAAQIVHEPKWPAIQKAIQGLDGIIKTVVCLVKIRDCHMDIGGGAGGRCVVAATFDNETFKMAIDPPRGREPISAKVNGQLNEYPAEVLVTKDVALKAAKLFSEKGVLEPSVQWRCTKEAPTAPSPATPA